MSKTAQCRDIKQLNSLVAEKVKLALDECNRQGLNMAITETLRTPERQDYLYEQGRTRPGKIITYATGKEMSSYHMWGLAVDIHHNVSGNLYPADKMKAAANIFKRHGFEWGGDWKSVDTPHFQMTFGLDIDDLKSGKEPPTTEYIDVNIREASSGKTIETVRCEAIKQDGHNFIKLRGLEGKTFFVSYEEGEIYLSLK